MNIENMTNKSKGSYAYTMLDTNPAPSQDVIDVLKNVRDVLKVRVIK